MAEYVIQIVCLASGEPHPFDGTFVQSFDFEAFDGQGEGVFTDDPFKAKKFASMSDAMEFCRTPSRIRPRRDDGKPNRPLTASSIHIALLADFVEGA